MKTLNQDYKVDISSLVVTDFRHPDQPKIEVRSGHIVNQFKSLLYDYTSARNVKETTWLECWAKYLGSPDANNWVRMQAHKTVGDVDNTWRHHITTSKGYEVVETINAYIQGATFPNHNWFDLQPVKMIGSPEYKKLLSVLTKFLTKKLDDAKIESNWDMFCRQLIITGSSVLALPWRYDVRNTKKNVLVTDPNSRKDYVQQRNTDKVVYNGLDFEVLDMFDTFLDPQAKTAMDCNLIRKFTKTKAELLRLSEMGVYNQIKPYDIKCLRAFKDTHTGNKLVLETFSGVNSSVTDWHPNEKVEVFEFWGNFCVNDIELNDVVITIADNSLLNIENNPFWHGKPFIVGTYTPMINSPYGLGALEPSLGNLHVQDLTLNQRLDGTELTLNPMFELTNDGTLDPDDVFSEPGKVFHVSQPGSIRPIQRDTQMNRSVEEENIQEQRINKATGVGAYLGVNSARSGERVTAAEVDAQRQAGGNRLNRVQRHIEKTALLPMLTRAYGYCQQFVVGDEVMRIKANGQEDGYEYIQVGVQELSYDMDIYVLGADHVADKEYELKQRLDFMQLVSQVPDMAARINWDEMLKDLSTRFLHDEAEKFIKEAEQAPPEQPQMPPQGQPAPTQAQGIPMAGGLGELPPEAVQGAMDAAKFSGGQTGQNALQQEVMTKGLDATMLQKMQGMGMAQ